MDTNVKVWDLKSKNAIVTLRNHRKKVTSLNITPDSRTLVSGDEQGIVQMCELRMQRIINQFEINSSILSIDTTLSSQHSLISIGSMDRLARIFMLSAPYSYVGQTKNQTMPINSCLFYQKNYLFTAGTDNLKVWKVVSSPDKQEYQLNNQYDHNGISIMMVDNIETSSKGILHMAIDDKVQQIAYSGGSLGYYECLLTEVNFDGNFQVSSYKDIEELSSPIIPSNQINKNLSTIKRGQSYKNHPTSLTSKSIQKLLSNQKTKQLFSKRNQSIKTSIAKQISSVNTQINDVLSNINKISSNIQTKKKQTSQIQDLLKMVDSQHTKFMKIINIRMKSIQVVLDLWYKQNFKLLVQHLKNIDIYVVSDVLGEILLSPTEQQNQKHSRFNISIEFGVVIAHRSKQMILSKHYTLIKNGINFLLKIVSLFKEEMIKLKLYGMDKGVDLLREERLKRFDQLIEEYIEVFQSDRIKKIINKNDDISKLGQQLQNELKQILNKVYGEAK